MTDKEQAAAFLSLFKHAAPGSFIALRGILHRRPQKGASGVILKESIRADRPDIVDHLWRTSNRIANIPAPAAFYGVIATFKTDESAKTGNTAQGLVATVECDEHAQRSLIMLTAILGPPTLVVASGGRWTDAEGRTWPKLHLHWRLARPATTNEELTLLYELRSLARQYVGADATCDPWVHPLRWPGSWHRKEGKAPTLVTVQSATENEIDLVAAVEALRLVVPNPEGRSPGDVDAVPENLHGEDDDIAAAVDAATAKLSEAANAFSVARLELQRVVEQHGFGEASPLSVDGASSPTAELLIRPIVRAAVREAAPGVLAPVQSRQAGLAPGEPDTDQPSTIVVAKRIQSGRLLDFVDDVEAGRAMPMSPGRPSREAPKHRSPPIADVPMRPVFCNATVLMPEPLAIGAAAAGALVRVIGDAWTPTISFVQSNDEPLDLTGGRVAGDFYLGGSTKPIGGVAGQVADPTSGQASLVIPPALTSQARPADPDFATVFPCRLAVVFVDTLDRPHTLAIVLYCPVLASRMRGLPDLSGDDITVRVGIQGPPAPDLYGVIGIQPYWAMPTIFGS